MNAPTYEKKDYSYLPETFQRASQGFRQFGQGLKTAMDIEGTERKRAQEDEIINNVRISNEEAELVRENLIADFATEIMKSKGLPSTNEGREAAYNIAVRYVYPLTPEERKTGTGLKRLWTQEQDKIPQFLKNETVKTWLNKVYQATGSFTFPKKQDIQEPVGTVGVEEEDGVRRPLASGPLSEQEVQQAAGRTLAEQPSYIEKMPSPVDLDLEQLWREATELGITDNQKVRNAMSYLQRQQIKQEQPIGEPLTSQYVATETYGMPVTDEKEVMKYLPKAMEEKDRIKLENDRLKALRKAVTKDEVDENINKAIARQDKLTREHITNAATITKLQQALKRHTSGKSLGKFSSLLQSLDMNPNDPNTYAIQSKIDELKILNEGIQGNIEEAKKTIKYLVEGKSLPEALKQIRTDEVGLGKRAINEIRKKFGPDTPRSVTPEQIIDSLPEELKRIAKQNIEKMRGVIASDEKIVDQILGRQPRE